MNHPCNSRTYMMNVFLTLSLVLISLKGSHQANAKGHKQESLKDNGGKTELGEAHPRGDGE